MKDVLRAYDRLAGHYDRRWRTYIDQTLDRAITLMEGQNELRILEIACGTGKLIQRLLAKFPKAAVVGVDGSRQMLAKAQAKFATTSHVSLYHASAQALPFRAASFDWVVCCNSLHCFPNAQEAIREMAWVLKPGGHALILDWCRDPWHSRILNRWFAWFDPAHVKMYTVQELRQLVEANAMSVKKMERFRVSIDGGPKIWEMMVCVGTKSSWRPAAHDDTADQII